MGQSFTQIALSLGLWLAICLWVYLAFAEARHFIRYDGKTKRGLKVSASRLSGSMEHFLRHLSRGCFEDGTSAFIKKADNTVLIQPIPRFFYRGFGVWYVGYVDLSQDDPRIEYRMPITVAVFLVSFVALMVSYTIIAPHKESIRGIFLMVFLAVLIPIAHAASAAKVRRFIRDMMSHHRS
jgi:hypothetical protein